MTQIIFVHPTFAAIEEQNVPLFRPAEQKAQDEGIKLERRSAVRVNVCIRRRDDERGQSFLFRFFPRQQRAKRRSDICPSVDSIRVQPLKLAVNGVKRLVRRRILHLELDRRLAKLVRGPIFEIVHHSSFNVLVAVDVIQIPV